MTTAAAWIGAETVAQGSAADASAVDAATPSIGRALFYGAVMPGVKHAAGLQSGGALGYSTFFTGYRPGMSNWQRMSVGRAGLQVVGATARMLAGTALGQMGAERGGVGDWLNRFKHVEEFGVGGVLASSRAATAAETADKVRDVTARYAATDATLRARGVKGLEVKDRAHRIAANKRNWAKAIERVHNPGTPVGGSLGRFLIGVLGGKGFEYVEEGGKMVEKLAMKTKTIDGVEYVMGAGSKGATVLKGPMGRLMGAGLKGAGYLEIGLMAAGFLGNQAGEAYGHLARAADRMKKAHSRQMSPAYSSRAAMNERQRAVATLQSSALAPRTQLMGNEAMMLHR